MKTRGIMILLGIAVLAISTLQAEETGKGSPETGGSDFDGYFGDATIGALVRAIIDEYDVDRNGRVDFQERRLLYRDLDGVSQNRMHLPAIPLPSEVELQRILEVYDLDGGGWLDDWEKVMLGLDLEVAGRSREIVKNITT